MARRNRDRKDRLEQQLVQVQRRFVNTPLAPIDECLASTISKVQRSVQVGGSSQEDADQMATYVASVLEFLPSSFGDRFTSDAQFIYTLAREYSRQRGKTARGFVPRLFFLTVNIVQEGKQVSGSVGVGADRRANHFGLFWVNS